MSKVTIAITFIRGLTTLLNTTHDPPSRAAGSGLRALSFLEALFHQLSKHLEFLIRRSPLARTGEGIRLST